MYINSERSKDEQGLAPNNTKKKNLEIWYETCPVPAEKLLAFPQHTAKHGLYKQQSLLLLNFS